MATNSGSCLATKLSTKPYGMPLRSAISASRDAMRRQSPRCRKYCSITRDAMTSGSLVPVSAAVANAGFGAFSLKLHVLRRRANGAIREKRVAFAHGERAFKESKRQGTGTRLA